MTPLPNFRDIKHKHVFLIDDTCLYGWQGNPLNIVNPQHRLMIATVLEKRIGETQTGSQMFKCFIKCFVHNSFDRTNDKSPPKH